MDICVKGRRMEHIADAFARIAESNAIATAKNCIVTCAGCKAFSQGGDWGWAHCIELRSAGLCQKQLWKHAMLLYFGETDVQ